MGGRDFELDTASRAVSQTRKSRGAIHEPPTRLARFAGWVGAARDVPSSVTPVVHRSILQLQRDYGNRYVQRLASVARQSTETAEAEESVEHAIESGRGGGVGLDSPVRGQMERAFSADFSGVRVHHDSAADSLNRDLEARAFTTGRDIFFRQGAYQPGTSTGRELIAHELTHVVQQNGEGVEKKTQTKLQTKMSVSQPGDAAEVEADHMARLVVRHETEPILAEQHQSTLDRQPESTKDKDEEERKKLRRSPESDIARSLAAAEMDS